MRKSLRFRLSIRGLLLLFVIVGILLANVFTQPHRQRRVVDFFRRMGGRVTHAAANADGEAIVVSGQLVSSWQRRVLGEVHFHVHGINLSRSAVSDSDLRKLNPLTTLRSLNLERTNITSLVHIRGLTNLRRLSLAGTAIDATGLKNLAHLERIESLDLRDTNVTDSSLRHLRGLTQLRELHLDNTRVTANGLFHLVGLTHLENLTVMGLDLRSADLEDPPTLAKKIAYVTRSDVAPQSQLLDALLAAWARRQRKVDSFAIVSAVREVGAARAIDCELQCVADSTGRVRLFQTAALQGQGYPPNGIIGGRTTSKLFRGDSGAPVGVPRAELTGEFFPIAVALRPFDGTIASSNLEATSQTEQIKGRICVVLYHAKGTVCVDPDREFVPVRYSSIRRGATYEEFDICYAANDKVGWVPTRWTRSTFTGNGTISSQSEATVVQLSINEPIAEDVFQMSDPSVPPIDAKSMASP